MISSQGGAFKEGASILAEVKTISGRRIEERRRREHISQKALAANVGIGVRWLREIESGNPKSRFDDHFRCAHALGLSAAHLLIPMLFLEHHMHFPRQLLQDDMNEIEERCIEFIAGFSLRPFLRRSSRPGHED
ncbi:MULTISPECIES: helix-turn-helix domain-containing protein [Sphingobium]|jgi:transcriptional regulator with XRE-family HTH domain|uniref:Transcriptional regulator n=1 Tax=Sphingobium yanoikuyae TaxID=13690 RepID=A0A3G2UQ81_SPHYA|nr:MULTISPECIES: helix-turn-helix domain-containing protein [Sphingobium]AYO77276.1 transcriptional regulator [Sphingobium yanoikuyae]MDV3482599.1 helix-turn-helix domain-containing protein [Sphingobium yanoikuyae]PHP17567.1 transcriptional regulator [Sphingobium sp. IP1]